MPKAYRQTLYACYLGYITQAIVVNLAPILFTIFQDQYRITFEMLGRLVLINFIVQLAVDIVSVQYVDRIGYRRAAVAAHAFSAAGLIFLGVLPTFLPSPYAGLLISVAVFAVGGGLIEVLVSPIVQSLPTTEKSSAMSLLHSFYCWGQAGVVLITTLLLQAAGHGMWRLLPFLWALVPLYNMVRFLKVPLMPAPPAGEKTTVRELFSSRLFLLGLLLMMSAGAAELSMSQWSSLFAEKGLGVTKLTGDLLGPCLFALLMGLGRVLYGIMGNRINLHRALLFCGAGCVLCYLTAVFAFLPVFSLLGCALCGLAVSLMWPGTLSLCAARYPMGGTVMFGTMAIFGDLGCSAGPWLAGIVSDAAQNSPTLAGFWGRYGLSPEQAGLRTGLSASLLFPVLFLLGTAFFTVKNKQN